MSPSIPPLIYTIATGRQSRTKITTTSISVSSMGFSLETKITYHVPTREVGTPYILPIVWGKLYMVSLDTVLTYSPSLSLWKYTAVGQSVNDLKEVVDVV